MTEVVKRVAAILKLTDQTDQTSIKKEIRLPGKFKIPGS